MRSHLTLTIGAAVLIGESVFAQSIEFLGDWEMAYTAPAQQLHMWVDTDGPAGGLGLSADAPATSITEALTFAQQFLAYPPNLPTGQSFSTDLQVTINVAPGLYDAANETFPLEIPAYGVSLEGWFVAGDLPFARPEIVADGVAAISVGWVGNDTLAPSVIQGLDITGQPAVEVDPSIYDANPAAPVEILGVEIRDNFIDGPIGIRLVTPTGYRSAYVVENNDVGSGEIKILSPLGGIGLDETCESGAAASTLYRSNRAQLYERVLDVENQDMGGEANCVPRIFSNAFQLGESIVNLAGCTAFVINNTIAFAVDLGGVPIPVGLSVFGGTLELHNNILWSPDNGATPADQVFTGGVVFENPPENNFILDQLPAGAPNTPGFLGGDALPVPLFGPVDLHLTPASVDLIGTGSVARVAEFDPLVAGPAVTVRSTVVAGLAAGADYPVRTDVNLDFDLESRVHDSGFPNDGAPTPQLDIGADEYRELLAAGPGRPARSGRIELIDRLGNAPATQNVLGHVLPQPLGAPFTNERSWNFELYLDGPPGGFWFVFANVGLFDQVLDPGLGALTPNGALYQNFLDRTILPAGSFALDPNPSLLAPMGSGLFGPLGESMLAVDLDVYGGIYDDNLVVEGELWFQMLTLAPNGRWSAGNRVVIELDDRE